MVGPGGALPAAAEDINAHALLLGSTPLLVLAARYRATMSGPAGELVAADALASEVLARGGKRLTDLSFASSITPGWRAVLTTGSERLHVTDATGTAVYDGVLTAASAWLEPVRSAAIGRRGLPTVLCSAGDSDAVLDAMESGRAVWVRADIEVR